MALRHDLYYYSFSRATFYDTPTGFGVLSGSDFYLLFFASVHTTSSSSQDAGSWFLEKTVTWWGKDLAAALHRHWTAIDRINDYGLINNDGYVMTCWGY